MAKKVQMSAVPLRTLLRAYRVAEQEGAGYIFRSGGRYNVVGKTWENKDRVPIIAVTRNIGEAGIEQSVNVEALTPSPKSRRVRASPLPEPEARLEKGLLALRTPRRPRQPRRRRLVR